MTVGELVAALQKHAPELRVLQEDDCAYLPVGSVSAGCDTEGPYMLIKSEWTTADRAWAERLRKK